jgi:hypothetical protein
MSDIPAGESTSLDPGGRMGGMGAGMGALALVVQDTIGIGTLVLASCMMLLAIPAAWLALRRWRAENTAREAQEETARFQRQMKAYVDQERRKTQERNGADD